MCRFNNALTPVYFRRADAFVIVYDVSDFKTFKSIKKWISIIQVICLSVVNAGEGRLRSGEAEG